MQGKQLSAYKITSDLGSGGMGKVYRAEVVDEVAGLAPGTLVALKVIHSHLLEKPGFFKRFLREAQVGQRVDDENVVKTYDCDATLVDGVSQHFLVMEYVAGQTLRDLLQELGRVPEELCRHIGREVAKGLSAIHDAGVVHLDISQEISYRFLEALALMEAGDPVEAGAVLDEAEALVGHTTRIDARFLLYQATGNKQHLEAAHDLLTFLVEHAPDTYRETTVTNVRLHRDILKAWAEHQAAS